MIYTVINIKKVENIVPGQKDMIQVSLENVIPSEVTFNEVMNAYVFSQPEYTQTMEIFVLAENSNDYQVGMKYDVEIKKIK